MHIERNCWHEEIAPIRTELTNAPHDISDVPFKHQSTLSLAQRWLHNHLLKVLSTRHTYFMITSAFTKMVDAELYSFLQNIVIPRQRTTAVSGISMRWLHAIDITTEHWCFHPSNTCIACHSVWPCASSILHTQYIQKWRVCVEDNTLQKYQVLLRYPLWSCKKKTIFTLESSIYHDQLKQKQGSSAITDSKTMIDYVGHE